MEWVYGLTVSAGALAATAIDKTGRDVLLPVDELATRGLPATSPKCLRVFEVDFAKTRVVPSKVYLKLFFPRAPRGLPEDHQIFELITARHRLIVPALALLRGIFQPARHIIPELVRPCQCYSRLGPHRSRRQRYATMKPGDPPRRPLKPTAGPRPLRPAVTTRGDATEAAQAPAARSVETVVPTTGATGCEAGSVLARHFATSPRYALEGACAALRSALEE